MPEVTIDPLRCQGSRACALVCPANVFAMHDPDPSLPFSVRLRVAFRGGGQARVMNAAACTMCLRCMTVCPEQAVRVVP